MGFLNNLLFPHFCLYCWSVGCPICRNCLSKFEPYYLQPKLQALEIDKTISLYHYNNQASFLLKKAKYRFNKRVLKYFLENVDLQILEQTRLVFKKLTNPILLFVPMIKEDERTRGYNQAELLANFLAKHFNFKVEKYLYKSKKTKRQSMLVGKSKRWQNVKNVYGIKSNKINQNQDIIVVDDVITSGATIVTIAKLLKTQTNGKVIVWSLFKSY